MQLDEVIRHALDGTAVLIAGAGYAMRAENADSRALPTGGQLCGVLADAIGLTSSTNDLGLLSEMYKDKHGENGLVSLLRDRLTAATTTDAQKAIAKLPWRRAYTTNYDNVLELASDNNNKFTSLTFKDDVAMQPKRAKLLVHCNGKIDKVDVRNFDSSIILTNASYMADQFNKSKWARVLREDLQAARAVLIVGYSLYDLDITRIIAATPEIKAKCHFVIEETPPEELAFKLRRFGEVSQIGVDALADQITAIAPTHVQSTQHHVFRSFIEHIVSSGPAGAVTDTEVFQLYVRGELRRDLLPGSYASPVCSYVLRRAAVDEVMQHLINGQRAVAIHSYLGNGKTVAAQCVAFKALQSHYAVFEFERDKPGFDRECDLIRHVDRPTLVIFEDYNLHYTAIEKLSIEANPNIRVLVTARTPTHIMEWSKLKESLGGIEPVEVSVEHLSGSDLADLDEMLSRHGLLGQAAATNRDVRLRRLRQDHGAEFRNILLWLLDSSHIKQRVLATFNSLASQKNVQSFVVAALLLRALGESNDIDYLVELVGIDEFNEAMLSRNSLVAEFVNTSGRGYVIRSPLFAVLVIRTLWPDGFVMSTLVEMIRRALSLRFDDIQMEQISRELMRFSRLEQFVPRNAINDLVEYYETIKNFNGCATNQFFWLQYAITRIQTGDYDLAARYLDTAYGLVKNRPGFDTYQLDNTRARLLLRRTIEKMPADGGFAAFRDAHRILSKQMRETGRGFYPFRVALLYGEFQRVAQSWSPEQAPVFLDAVRFVLARAKAVDQRLASHADVRKCIEVLTTLLPADAKTKPS